MTTTQTDRLGGSSTIAGSSTDLEALEALSGTGWAKRTATNTWQLDSSSTLRTSLSINNTDNTSDANKPVSTAQQTALDAKAALAGATYTGAIVCAVGTNSLAPFKLQSGTNLTTATAGVLEYDGKVAYFTAAASSRQVVVSEQLIRLTSTYQLANQQAAQALFNAPANGRVTVQANTTYQFECWFDLSSMSASSGSFGFAIAGTATLTRQKWWTLANKATLATAAAAQSTVNTSANTAIATATTATVAWAYVRGVLTIGNSGGTVIPQVSLGVAAAAVVSTDAYFRIWAEGADTVQSVGNWS